jgi:hypothetical protein
MKREEKGDVGSNATYRFIHNVISNCAYEKFMLFFFYETINHCRCTDYCFGIAGRNSSFRGIQIRPPAPWCLTGGPRDELSGGQPSLGGRPPNGGILGSSIWGKGGRRFKRNL